MVLDASYCFRRASSYFIRWNRRTLFLLPLILSLELPRWLGLAPSSVPHTLASSPAPQGSPLLGHVVVPDVPQDVPAPELKSKTQKPIEIDETDSEEEDDDEDVENLVQSGDEHDHGDVFNEEDLDEEDNSSSSSSEEELSYDLGMGKEKFIKLNEKEKRMMAQLKEEERKLKKKMRAESKSKSSSAESSAAASVVVPQPIFPEVPRLVPGLNSNEAAAQIQVQSQTPVSFQTPVPSSPKASPKRTRPPKSPLQMSRELK